MFNPLNKLKEILNFYYFIKPCFFVRFLIVVSEYVILKNEYPYTHPHNHPKITTTKQEEHPETSEKDERLGSLLFASRQDNSL